MAVFKDSQHFYACVGELLVRASKDPDVGAKIAKSGLVIQFRYTDPEAIQTINARDKATQPGAFVDIVNGPTALKPDIVMSMKADVSHAFWHGKVNLLTALTKKEIVAEGPIPKILKLLPVVQPLYAKYPALLKELGYADLILK